MQVSYFANMKKEKKLFLMFLLIHFVVWSCTGLIRTVLPTDSLEAIYWGSLLDLGTPKHPPLAGWLTYFAYQPFKNDISVYILSQIFIIIGMVYIYKLAKFFLNDLCSMLSVIVLEGCWVYSYITGYYGFNPDVVLLCFLPIITYYFYKCMNDNKASDWIKLGIIAGLSFLNKYQTGLIIIPMALWAAVFNRKTFINKYFYLAIVIAFFIFLPHLLWLIKYDFFPFMYFSQELDSPALLNHITAPLVFLLVQFSLIAGVLAIFGILKVANKSQFKLIKDYKTEDLWFILLLGLGPNIIHLIMGFIEGGTMRPRWGFEFWFMTGIMLFYLFPVKISLKEFLLTLKMAFVAMFIIFLSLGTLLSVEKNYRSRYPVATIYGDLNAAWNNQTNLPLKYIGGYIEWTLPLTIYAESHPDCILDTFGYKNPWIDSNDVKSSGILIIGRTKELVKHYTFLSCPFLNSIDESKIVEYKFNVTNFFRQPREYTIYYYINPPQI